MTLNDFIKGTYDFAIHCKTKEEFMALVRSLSSNHVLLSVDSDFGDTFEFVFEKTWNINKENTVVYMESNKAIVGNTQDGFPAIVEFCNLTPEKSKIDDLSLMRFIVDGTALEGFLKNMSTKGYHSIEIEHFYENDGKFGVLITI